MVDALLALLATLGASVATGLLVSRAYKDRLLYLIAWSFTQVGLTLALLSMGVGFLAGFNGPLFRVMELGAALIGPLWLALGMIELIARYVQVRFAAWLFAVSYTVVAIVILLVDPLKGSLHKSLPKPGDTYDALPTLLIDGGHVVAVIALVGCTGFTAWLASKHDREAGELLIPVALVALAGVLVVSGTRGFLPAPVVVVAFGAAVGLVWYGAMRTIPVYEDDEGDEPPALERPAAGRRRKTADRPALEQQAAEQGFDQQNFDQQGFEQGFDQQQGFDDQQGFDQQGYDQQQGFEQVGYEHTGYDQHGQHGQHGRPGQHGQHGQSGPHGRPGYDQGYPAEPAAAPLPLQATPGPPPPLPRGELRFPEQPPADELRFPESVPPAAEVPRGGVPRGGVPEPTPPGGMLAGALPLGGALPAALPGPLSGAAPGAASTDLPGGRGQITVFTLREGRGDAFDRLAADLVQATRAAEPDTLIFASHEVVGAPAQRIFYQLFRDDAAYTTHRQQPHLQRFLAECRAHVVSTNVIELRVGTAKVPLPSPEYPGR